MRIHEGCGSIYRVCTGSINSVGLPALKRGRDMIRNPTPEVISN